MKIIENVTLYKCDHCGKEYKRKYYAEKHEKQCSSNPDNYKPCLYCENLIKKKASILFDTYHGEHREGRDLLYCEKIKSFLYPPKVEFKGNAFLQEDIEDGETENKPMPKECNHFDDRYSIFTT